MKLLSLHINLSMKIWKKMRRNWRGKGNKICGEKSKILIGSKKTKNHLIMILSNYESSFIGKPALKISQRFS